MMGLNELGNRVILKHCLLLVIGGEGGIRTHGRETRHTLSRRAC
jgi:hypothetical protein